MIFFLNLCMTVFNQSHCESVFHLQNSIDLLLRIVIVVCQGITEINWESPAQFENRIKPRVYIRDITCCTLYVRKSSILLAGTGVRENSTVTSWSSPIKIQF